MKFLEPRIIISGGNWSEWFRHSNYLDKTNCEAISIIDPDSCKNCFDTFFYSCRMVVFRKQVKYKNSEGVEVKLYGHPSVNKLETLLKETRGEDRILLLASTPKEYHDLCDEIGSHFPIKIFNGFDPSPKELRTFINVLYPQEFNILTEEFLKALKSRLRFKPDITNIVLALLIEKRITEPTVKNLTELGVTSKVFSNLAIFERFFSWGRERKPMWYKMLNSRHYSVRFLAKIWVGYLKELELVYLDDPKLRISDYRRLLYERLLSEYGYSRLALLKRDLSKVRTNVGFLSCIESFWVHF